jgi:hypothetical protein
MTMSVSAGVNGGVATLNGTSCGTFAAGAVDCTGYFVALTGTADTYTITYSSPPYTAATQTVTLLPGAASKVVVTTGVAGFVNRANFTTQPVATIQDASGNTVTSSTANVTVSINSGNLTGTTTLAAVNGVADWSTAATPLGKNGLVGSKTLTFASAGLTSDTTQTFTLTHGSVSQLAVATRIQPSGSGAPTYYPSGPQQNVAVSTVTSGGWTQCYVQLFNGAGTTLETNILNNCTQPYLLVAGRATGSSTLLVAAAAPRADVFAATTANNKTISNGTGWYYRTGYSMGFADPSQALNLSSCDFNNTGWQRFCVHLASNGGYRIGDIVGLNSSTAYERIYYQAGASVAAVANDQTFVNQPVVQIQDQDGNICTSSSSAVVASMTSGLSGTTTVNAVNGVATFSGLKFTGLIGSKSITYTLDQTAISVADTFTVVAGTPNKVTLVTSASGAVSETKALGS